MKSLTVSVLLYSMMTLTRANTRTCVTGWTDINGRCFHYETQQRTWTQAQQFCQAMGGNLASVQSHEEHNRVQQLTTPNLPPTWIGGSDCQESASWFWIDGAVMLYNFWCPEKPDNAQTECCLQMNTGDGHCWDDANCNTLLPSVCVKNP